MFSFASRAFAAASVFVAALFAPAAAAVPTTITYAGVLADGGAPLNATVDVSFTIFSADSGGTVLYSEDDPGTVVLDGQLVVELGRNNLDDSVLDAPDLFLEVSVDGDALSPRVRLTSVPFALRAAKAQEAAVADALGGLAEADVVTQAQLITLHLDRGLVAGTGLTFTNGTIAVASAGIGTAQIADGAVTTAKLAGQAVTHDKLASGVINHTLVAGGTSRQWIVLRPSQCGGGVDAVIESSCDFGPNGVQCDYVCSTTVCRNSTGGAGFFDSCTSSSCTRTSPATCVFTVTGGSGITNVSGGVVARGTVVPF